MLQSKNISKVFHLYSELLRNPFAPKNYKELVKYYEDIGMQNEADAFRLVVKTKFTDVDNTYPDQEQQPNNISMPGLPEATQ